jgi:hypothetical protein
MSHVRARRFRPLAALIAALVLAPTLPVAAQDELVVVDQADFDRYWRADLRRAATPMLREGPLRYGCVALPFVIETDGRVAPGTKPLLVRLGQSADAEDSGIDLVFTHVIGLLPPFQPTFGAPPSAPIYSSRSLVVGDARVRARLGDEAWARLHERLAQMCEIRDLAGWLQRHNDQVVVRPLPADPKALLDSQPEAPPR